MRPLPLRVLQPLRGIYGGPAAEEMPVKTLNIKGKTYPIDDYTNVTPKILSHLGRNLHNREQHPLCLLKKRIVDHFYKTFVARTGNPVFSVYDNLDPVVSVQQNFDSLLIPKNHVSRNKSDCYYINRNYLLRGHTTSHQAELIRMGLDNFLIFGDVYRRDEVDSTHYPVFHQTDGVRLLDKEQLSTLYGSDLEIFEKAKDSRGMREPQERQREHTIQASKVMEFHLKNTLLSLAETLYGKGVPHRWVDVYFPFTHPSWELEIEFDGVWMELLGCGLIRNQILQKGGALDRIGWAFGIGLERTAMRLYKIPDIRTFWSEDTGFLSQFEKASAEDDVEFKPVSIYPQCINDMSFWLPETGFEPNDFYELVRDIGGELIEQVKLFDDFTHPKTGRKSHCYKLVYRHVDRTLSQGEVSKVHKEIARLAEERLKVEIR